MSADWVKQGNYAAAHFTTMQGRVLFHMERLFRSTGGGIKAHARYVELCHQHKLPRIVTDMDHNECIDALRLIELACREVNMHFFRNVITPWRMIPLAA